MKATHLIALALILALFAATETATAEMLYGLRCIAPNQTQLVYLDKSNGHVVHQFPYHADAYLTSAAMDDCDGTLYAWSEQLAVNPGLYSVDKDTGEFVQIGPNQWLHNVRGLALHPDTGVLYAVTYPGRLYTIDKSDGTPTLIGSDPSLDFAHGLAFSLDGELYCVDTSGSGTSKLFTLDPSTGEASLVAIVDRDKVVSLDFDIGGALYGVDNGTQYLGIIDVATGAWTDVGCYGAGPPEIQGFAFERIPEPNTLTLIVLVGTIIAWRRR